ncbi:MAG TPA: flagellar FliJ family protein [Candidatus Saccharimonadales bacterium]|nr:flagellar FliJ family protein [Candidatus Saccharimonadales bacterium]
MKSFRFSLQSLRVLREQKEQVAQKRYVEALRASETAAGRLYAGSRELADARSVLCREVLAGNFIGRLQQLRSWCRYLELRCEQLAAALQAAEQTVAKTWREMMLATRERKALDSLHRQRRLDYDHAVQRDEQHHLDEVGLRFNESSPSLREVAAMPMEQP